MHRILISFAFAAFAAGTGLGAGGAWVASIGSNESFESDLPSLAYADQDAERFARAMEIAGQVPSAQIASYSNPKVRTIRRLFNSLIRKTSKAGDLQKFIFFFSGHSDERGLHLKDGIISKTELHDFLEAVDVPTKVAILDSCYSGSLATKGIEPVNENFIVPSSIYDEPSGTVFLTASSSNESAFESKTLKGSVFSHHLVSGLYGSADSDRDGLVTIDELYQFVYRRSNIDNLTKPLENRQKPEFHTNLQGKGALVLAKPISGQGTLKLSNAMQGELKLYSSYGMNWFFISKEAGTSKALKLPKGTYDLSVDSGGMVGQKRILLLSNSMVVITPEDLKWQKVSTPKAQPKGISSSKMSTTPGWYLVAAGTHSGYFENQEFGPSIELGALKEAPALGEDFQWLSLLQYRQNEMVVEYAEQEDMKMSSWAVALYVGGSYEFYSVDNQAFHILGAVGLGQLYQDWEDAPSSVGVLSRLSGLFAGDSVVLYPGAQIGLSYSLPTSSKYVFGVGVKREWIMTEDELLGRQVLGGNILNVHLTF